MKFVYEVRTVAVLWICTIHNKSSFTPTSTIPTLTIYHQTSVYANPALSPSEVMCFFESHGSNIYRESRQDLPMTFGHSHVCSKPKCAQWSFYHVDIDTLNAKDRPISDQTFEASRREALALCKKEVSRKIEGNQLTD